MSEHSATVLEYAPPLSARSSVARILWNVFYRGLLIVLGLVIGAGLGFAMTPTHTFGVALYKVPDPTGTLQPAAIQTAQQAQITRMKSPAMLDSVLATLQAQGHALPSGQMGRDKLLDNLNVQVISNSRLLQVMFESKDARLCVDAVSAVVDDTTVVSNVGPGTIFTQVNSGMRRSKVGVIAGALVGVITAAALMIRHHHRSQSR